MDKPRFGISLDVDITDTIITVLCVSATALWFGYFILGPATN